MAAPERGEHRVPADWEEPSEQQAEAELSIGQRLGNWKSIASFAFAVVVLAFAIVKGGIDPAATWQRIRHVNPLLYFLAFLVYYATFPIRGYRWKVLLDNAYRGDEREEAVEGMSVRGLTEILYISWFVNCVVPAKLGDLYRAYLAKLWAHISFTKTIGTVLAERVVDILVLGFLLALTGFVAFHGRLGAISSILLLGLGLSVVGIIALLAMKHLSPWIHRVVPERFEERYSSFEDGTLSSLQRIPLLLVLTTVIWLMEGARLQLVFSSLNIHAHFSSVPFAPLLFFALATAVLTTIPFTPGGLGLVEAGLLGMMIYLGMPKTEATAVVLVDRVLSYLSVAVFGFIVYLLSKRSHFRHPV